MTASASATASRFEGTDRTPAGAATLSASSGVVAVMVIEWPARTPAVAGDRPTFPAPMILSFITGFPSIENRELRGCPRPATYLLAEVVPHSSQRCVCCARHMRMSGSILYS
jgi:hypothetical protein